METVKKPERTFEIEVNGEKQEIKMSFALLQEVMKVIPAPESVTDLLIQDFHLREYVVRRMLTGNKRVKSDEDLVDLFEIDVDDEALEDMVIWVTDHILHFFITTVQKTGTLGEKYRDQMKATIQSAQSQTGSAN